MSDLFAVAGSKIYIGPSISPKITDFVAGDFNVLAYTEVDGWETAGSVGDSSEIISTPLINRNRVVKQKGTNDAGDMECNFAIIASDPGQAAMIAAQGTKLSYAIKIDWSDGVTEYFAAMVASRARAGGNANTVQMRSFTLSINSNVVAV